MKYKIIMGLLSFAISNSAHCSQNEILDTYGKHDLSKKEAFKGDYINFGYWKNIDIFQSLSESNRIKASEDLYKLIFQELGNPQDGHILEVGCGIGNGCILLHKINSQSKITGIDITPEQIQRARYKYENYLKLNPQVNFINKSATDTTFDSNSLDSVYSIEAAQYFPSIEIFANEMHRILRPKGRLVITAHFSTNQQGYDKVKNLLPTVRNNIDRMIPINEVRSQLCSCGLHEIKFYSIGEYVFEGFNKWISQVEDVECSKNIYTIFKENLIDYYVIVLEK